MPGGQVFTGLCGTSDLEIEREVRETGLGGRDRSSHWNGLGLGEGPVSMREMVMSQQSARRAARRSALDAQAVLRKERADRERRLEALAVEVLTALGERDGAVRDAERRAGGALLAMTDDEGLSAREAANWCGSGVTVRGGDPLRRLVDLDTGGGTR
jgi:hypothetical protein